ncbi:MAG TPA: enoyl-CoA hydratase-related protein [Gemmatimonadaceae bacterium]
MTAPTSPAASSPVSYEVADRIATITVNRPDRLNALDRATLAGLGEAIDRARASADVLGVIVTGAGRAFVAGADISQFPTLTEEEARRFAHHGQHVFRRFETSPKPVIAAVNGFALGGGCELALACHVRIASEAAKLGQPEVKLGIIPGYGGTQRLPRLVGKGRALQLILTGETIDAEEALRIGLVNAVVPAAELIAATRKMMGQMIANGPVALALAIETVDRGLDLPLEEAIALEAENFGRCATTTDMREGARAFLEKRAPNFTGR